MILKAIAAMIWPAFIGFFLVPRLWPGLSSRRLLLLRVALSLGFGIGVVSCLFFAWTIIFGVAEKDLRLALFACVSMYVFFWIRNRKAPDFPPREKQPLAALIIVVLGLVMLTKIGAFLVEAFGTPYGDWDAWSIWNARAKFMFLGGADWGQILNHPDSACHPDYPLLLPSIVASSWTIIGTDAVEGPIIIALVFTFSTVLLAYAALTYLRGRIRGFLAALTLMGTPLLILHGARQCADVPISFFMLATVVLLFLYTTGGARFVVPSDKDAQERIPPEQPIAAAGGARSVVPSTKDAQERIALEPPLAAAGGACSVMPSTNGLLALAGATAAMAAWTKNEGILFFAAAIAALLILSLKRRSAKVFAHDLALFIAGAAPILAALIYFKVALAPRGDILSAGGIWAKLSDPSRYGLIIHEFLKQVFTFGHWDQFGPIPLNPVPLLIAAFFFFGVSVKGPAKGAVAASAIALLIMLAGFFFIYLITPHDLDWHLRTSCDRLFLQLWPSAVFLCFMSLKSP